ncbi:MAG: chitobiase/beta-hexosaminidase C-terminal domain-containing protein, partial [Parcubacteria group bacterium]
PWYTNAGMTDETSPNAITNDASGISLYDATLNGTNGDYDATGHSFWVSLAPFATASPNIPSGVYSTPDFGPIAADADFNVALSLVTTQGIHSNMPAITPNTKYYYVAWSRVGNVWYPGEMKNFTTAPLLAPTLIAPENNSFVKGIPTLTNSWSSVPSAVKYEYESYHDEGMDNLRYSDTYTETSKTADNVSDATFWWHVRAVDAAGNKGPWSDLWKVTIDNTAPTTPQFSSPADNSFTNVNTITLKWTDGDDAGSGVKGYTFRYVFYPANGGNPVVDWSSGFVAGIQKMRSGSFGHGEGRYVMYVKTTDNAGNESLESNPLTITYDNIAPTVALDFAGTGANVTGFKAVFSEDVNKADAENPAHYFLHNWPGLGDTDLFGHADIIYDQTTHTTTVKFKTYGWYVSPEQEWGVENIHDLAGNLLVKNPYAETSTPMVAPVTTDSGTDDNWHNSAVTVSLNCTDVDGSGCKKTYYTTNGTDPTIASPSGNAVTLSAEGVYTIKYFSVDNAGNVEDVKTAVKTVNIDMTAPVVSITAPAAGFVKGTVDIRGTVTEEHPDHYWLAIYKKSNNQEIFSTVVNHTDQFENQALYLWDTTKVDDGEYQIKFAERDLDYNTGNRSSDFVTDVAVDNTKPTSTITGGDNNGIIYYNDWNGIVTGTSSDALSGVKGVKVSVQRTSDNKYWNGTAWQMDEITNDAAGTTAWSYNINTVLTENVYTIKSHAVDEMGNVENTYTLTIVFDKTIPEVNLSIDSNSPDGDNGWYDSTPEITLTASDNTKLDKIEYQIDSQTGAWTTYALPVKIDDGKHIFYYRSLDLAKNYSNVGSKNVKVDAQDPPTVKGVSAQYDKNKNAVKLNWDASDDDIYKVYIYKGDNKHFAINSGSRIAENDDNNEDLTDSDVETSEKYYYKFVSVDEAGNKSDTKIIAISIKPDGGATVTDEGVENTPAGAVAGANATENQDQASEAQSAAEGQEGQNGGNGQVEGTSITNDSASAQPHRNWWWVLAVAIVFFLGVEYQRRKKKMNLPKMN